MWLVAVIIIVLLIVVYFTYYTTHKTLTRREKVLKLLEESNGEFDAPAREAFQILSNIADPTPEDLIHRGDILRFNVAAGNPNPQTAQAVLRDYTQAMVVAEPLIGVNNDQPGQIAPEFIIDRLLGFTNNLGVLFDDTRELENAIVAQVMRDTAQIAQNAQHNAQRVHEKVINDRRVESAAASKVEAINNFLDNSITHTNDLQNVHDSTVNKDLRHIYDKVKMQADPQLVKSTLADIEQAANNQCAKDTHPTADFKRIKIMKVLELARAHTFISTFNDYEDHILTYVWERGYDPRNNTRIIHTAVLDAMADSCSESGLPVCINGRCGRYLNSLAVVDYDPTITGAMTYEAYKNQIYQETKDIVNDEIEQAKDSGPDMQRVARAYEGGDIPTDSAYKEAEDTFKQQLRSAIDSNLRKYKDKLTPAEIEKVRGDCYTAFDI